MPQRRRRRGTYRSRLANTVTGGFGFGLGLTNCVADHLSRGRGTSCSGRVAVAANSYLIACLPVCSKTTRSAGKGRGPGEAEGGVPRLYAGFGYAPRWPLRGRLVALVPPRAEPGPQRGTRAKGFLPYTQYARLLCRYAYA